MINTNFAPFPEIVTGRLVLRQLEAGDAEDIFAHRCKDAVNTYLENFRHASVEDTRAFIKRVRQEIADGKSILWVLTRKGSNRFIGTICLWNISKEACKAETGYTLEPEFHKMGYMHEAMIQVIDFGFNTIKLATIEAYTHEHNQGSIALLLRNNFRQELEAKKPVSSNRLFFTLSNETLV